MAPTDSIRSTAVLAITQQKFSCFKRDQSALAACICAIDAQCGRIGPEDLDADITRLRIKAHRLHELRLANEESSADPAAGAIAFLQLAEGDSPLEEDVLAWNTRLDDVLLHLRKRVQHGMVFSEVLNEWLVETHTAAGAKRPAGQSSGARDLSQISNPDPMPPSTSLVPVDFLTSHNVNAGLLNQFDNLATRTRRYGLELLKPDYVVQPIEVKRAIEAIASDARLNGPEVRAQLRELGSLADIVDELAAAFTITRRHLAEWQWSPTGIRSDLQKHLSGKERAFLNIETNEMIFLETIGQEWMAHFRDALVEIRSGENWPETHMYLKTDKAKHIESMLQMLEASRVDQARLKIPLRGGVAEADAAHSLDGFVSALRSGSYTQYTGTDTGQKVVKKAEDGWGGVIDASRTAATHSEVFRRLRTDIALTRAIAPADDLFVLHGDIENFGPSVPHHVTLEVLAFFGLPQEWLKWFKRYLKLPRPESSSTITTATCGTPFGLSISLLVNELLLVILDCALAADTGVVMHRQHDDLWGWSTKGHQVERVWAIMQEFASQTGLSWNVSKTGCTTVRGAAGPIDPDLPSSLRLPGTPIKWGLLELQETGQWSLNQQSLDDLATAMRNEIRSDRSISFLSRITLWNKYHGYIARNVGPITPENWSSQIPTLLSTLRSFQELVLGSRTLHDNLVEHFRKQFPAYSDYQLTKAILSWPVQLGGFQLHSHAIRAMVCTKKVNQSPGVPPPPAFADELSEAKRAYDRYHRSWTSEWGRRAWLSHAGDNLRAPWVDILDRPDPVTEADFIRWHALRTEVWQTAYHHLTSPVVISSDEIAETMGSVYGALARDTLDALGKGLVDEKLVPKHAAAEIDAATRDMFTSV